MGVVLHRLPAVVRLLERAAIHYANYVGDVRGNLNASVARYGFAIMTTTGLRARRQDMTRTEFVEERNVLPRTSM